MHGEGFFLQALIYLGAAVIAVPIAKKLGLGSVLGYLLAGMIIGPFGLELIGQEGQDVMHFAEFGVVMMLFVVGLELEPALLWRLRMPILGLGGLQVIACAALFAALFAVLGGPLRESIAIGLILAMSSTAIVLQSLGERGRLHTTAGQSAFAVLLFQDIAVIPILAILPLLAGHAIPSAAAAEHATSWVSDTSGPVHALVVLGTVGGIVLFGHFGMRPIFRILAAARMRELFVAGALLLVVGVALLMTRVGLSPALGTFVAGVVLAGSEYRHELESDIEPFKGLLLGLFFIAVGVSIDFRVIGADPLTIGLLVVAVLAVKLTVLAVLGRSFRLGTDQNVIFSLSLWQVGEFAFVLLSFATQNGVLESATSSRLNAVVAISMALTPLLMLVGDRLILPRVGTRPMPDREPDTDLERSRVIVAGFGRFGQITTRFLRANGIHPTVLEHDSDQVDLLRRFGQEVYYGDATRHDLLQAAGAAEARVLVIAIDDPEKAVELVHTARKHFPQLTILARAQGRTDAYSLINAGAGGAFRETFDSALRVGIETLRSLGVRAHRAHRAAHTFRRHDDANVVELAALRQAAKDDEDWLDFSRDKRMELEKVLHQDLADDGMWDDGAWDPEGLRDDVVRGTFPAPPTRKDAQEPR